MWEKIIESGFLFKLAAGIAEIAVGFFLGPLIKKQILKFQKARHVDHGLLTFSGSAASISIRILAIVIALAQIGVNMSVIVGALSALGLGISLALKENMSNVASGIQILITKPFRVGDYIANESFEGNVSTIEIMFTTLSTFDQQKVIIPNAQLISTPIVNYSVYPQRRVSFTIPISRACDYESLRAELLDMIKSRPGVLKDPAPSTVVAEYSQDGMSLLLRVICFANQSDYWNVVADVRNQTEQIVQKHENAIPQENVRILK